MDGSTGPHAVQVRVVTEEGEWDQMRLAWSELFEVSPNAATPLHFDWLRTWWRIFGPHYGRGLRIVTVWRAQQLLGVLPLYMPAPGALGLGIRSLRFLSTGEAEYEETCPDYLGMLCRAGEEEACVKGIRVFLASAVWDQLVLLDMLDSSPLLAAANLAGGGGRAQVFPRGTCAIANLDGGFETYLQRLSAKNRQGARQMLREAERNGAVLELAGEAQSDEFFGDLVRLHQHRWEAVGKPGVFSAPRFTEFHRALVRQWLPSGKAVLARLSVADQPVAAVYGFITGPKFDFYQSGVRTTQTDMLRSPGNLANLLLMRELIYRRVTRYDYLRGTAAHKIRFATEQATMAALEVWRPTLRAKVYQSARLVRRVIGQRLGRLRRPSAPPPTP